MAYDPYFILPAIGIVTSYTLLNYSNNLPYITKINISFMVGLMTIGIPAVNNL